MKIINFLCFIVCFNISYSQGSVEYFLKEQIIVSGCESAIDSNKCLYEMLNEELDRQINDKKNFKRMSSDSLTIHISFLIDDENEIDDSSVQVFTKNKEISTKSIRNVEEYVKNLSVQQILNPKGSKFIAFHKLSYTYVLDSNTNKYMSQEEQSNIYTGGDVKEHPKLSFECDSDGYYASLECFKKGVSKHIGDNFGYDDYIKKHNVQGTIYIAYSISANCKVKALKIGGLEDDFLRERAVAIIESLPVTKALTINGEPVETTYAIPFVIRNK
ncbi:hypothetical protein [Joostella sp. CR20]|uniref:hypothetical protein n=1 Tax=Joostella sp. CR20 TaxID=2804312 RepID=UPI00313E4338